MAQIATPRLGAGRQTGLGAAPRPPIRPPGRRGRVAARAQRGGVAVVHIFENLRKPALFDSFLEGMTHVIEVVRCRRLPTLGAREPMCP